MRSLRARVTLLSTLLLVTVLAVASVLIVSLVDRELRNDLASQNDETLSDIVEQLNSGRSPFEIQLPFGADGTEFAITSQDGRWLNASVAQIDFFGQVVPGEPVFVDAITGQIIEPPPGLVGSALTSGVVRLAPGEPQLVLNDALLTEFFADERFWEVTSRGASGPDGARYNVLALASTKLVERSVSQVRSVLWLVIPVLAMLFGGLAWFTTGRALKPVDEIAGKAARISTETLHERVDQPGTNDEIDRLARTLNSMLDRLDKGVQQQRQFVSDASHELQSPLTVMIGEAELAAKNDDRLPSANQAVLQHGRRMSVLIKDLLDLAIHGEARHRPGEVDIDDLLRTEARQQPIPIGTRGVSPAKIIGDEGAIGRLFRNLLDNAAAYCDQRVEVGCSIDRSGRTTLIWVDDDGPGIAAAERDTVFERFSRLDPSRDRTTGGTGLGLAIAKAIVDAHRGSIAIERSPLGGARIRVELPVGAVIPA